MGFVTGGQMANTTCLAGGAQPRAGAPRLGRGAGRAPGAPRVVRCSWAGAPRHDRHRPARARASGPRRLWWSRLTRPAACGRSALAATAARVEGPDDRRARRSERATGAPLTRWARSYEAVRRDDLWVHVDGPSGSGPGPPGTAPPRRPASSAPTSGPPTPTSGSTRPTTAAWPSARTPPPTAAPMGVRAAYLPDGRRRRPARPDRLQPGVSRRAGRCPSGRRVRQLGAGGGRAGGALLPRWPSGSPTQLCRGRRRRGAAPGPQPGGRPVPRPEGARPRRPLTGRGGRGRRRRAPATERDGVARASARCACRSSSWRTGPEDVDRSVAALLAAHRGATA